MTKNNVCILLVVLSIDYYYAYCSEQCWNDGSVQKAYKSLCYRSAQRFFYREDAKTNVDTPSPFITHLSQNNASTVHRVLNMTGKERYSIPFVLKPNAGTTIESLPTCLREGEVSTQVPQLSHTILSRRYQGTFAHNKNENDS